MSNGEFVIIGAGPAGLSAAHLLATEKSVPSVMLEKDIQVGGLSKTLEHNGFRCDIGGHRFFTKSQEVESLWRKVLPDDFLKRPRLSRIYYRGKFFYYPVRAVNALLGLGPIEGASVLASYARSRLFPRRPEVSFEDWVSNRFGYRLYSIFFRTYTQKVWGIPCTELSADWAAQRIRNLDLMKTVLNAIGIGRGTSVASLIEEFDYPRFGPGQMYEAMALQATEGGASLRLSHQVKSIRHEGGRIVAVDVETPDGPISMDVGQLLSTMPLSELVLKMSPEAPAAVRDAAMGLHYRSIVTANLIVERPELVPDTWVYLHAPEVKAGRLQLYKNWSPSMVPDPKFSSVGLEYFATEGDGMWQASDPDVMGMGREDLKLLGMAKGSAVTDGFVARYAKAYPVYDDGYAERVATIRQYLDAFGNLECAGRYGQFRYNNMDHSILTGRLAARKLAGEDCDPWSVNVDEEYHEEK